MHCLQTSLSWEPELDHPSVVAGHFIRPLFSHDWQNKSQFNASEDRGWICLCFFSHEDTNIRQQFVMWYKHREPLDKWIFVLLFCCRVLIKTLTQVFVIVSAALILSLELFLQIGFSYAPDCAQLFNNCIMFLVALKEATQNSKQPAKNVAMLMPNCL